MNEENNQNGTAGYNFDFANQVNPNASVNTAVESTPVSAEPTNVEPIAPAVDNAVPNVEPIAPAVDNTVPNVEPLAPVVDNAIPNIELIAPAVDNAIPNVEPIAPAVDNAVPNVEASAPVMEETPNPNAMLTGDTVVQDDLQSPKLVDVSVPVAENNSEVVNNIADSENLEGQQEISLDNSGFEGEQNVQQDSASKITIDDSSKNTIKFVIILGVIIVATIIALPYIYNLIN